MQFGLLGEKLGHSYSPQIHRNFGDYPYQLFEKQPEELEDFLKNGNFVGINVTIPYKKAVIPYCDSLSERAKQLGAVNTIVRQKGGRLVGHNTDYFGFASMVARSGLIVADKKVLVLGSGGASVTAVAVLQELGANVVVISRTGENNYTNLANHKDTAIIVNTTPVGMYPNTDASPVDISIFPELEGVLDVIYNPANTKLLQAAQVRNLIAINGLWMLVAQAKESAEWFMGHKIPDGEIASVHATLKQQMENIVLVGMPGCGKSTIGALLAEKMGKQFIDADAEIVNTAGMSIPDIFSNSGEAGFREIETAVLKKLGKQSGLVIATGGGCVTREENYPVLHQNGKIIWIRRNIAQLPTDGRPLSQTNDLQQMYRQREPLYARFSDFSVENNDTPGAVVSSILGAL